MFWFDLFISPRPRTAVVPCFLSFPSGLVCCGLFLFFSKWPWLSPSLLLSEFPGFWIGYSWDSNSWQIGTRGVLCCFLLYFSCGLHKCSASLWFLPCSHITESSWVVGCHLGYVLALVAKEPSQTWSRLCTAAAFLSQQDGGDSPACGGLDCYSSVYCKA